MIRGYLEARQGRPLEPEEFDDFRLVVAAVTRTLELLPPIDELVGRAAEDALDLEKLGLSTAV